MACLRRGRELIIDEIQVRCLERSKVAGQREGNVISYAANLMSQYDGICDRFRGWDFTNLGV